MILYIHGFRSRGNGKKTKALQAYFPNEKVISPSLTTNTFKDIQTLKDIIKAAVIKGERIIVIGTSLGGFYAYYLSRAYCIPCVLINPCFNPSESLKDSIGIHTIYGSENPGNTLQETCELTQEDLEYFKILERHIYMPIDRSSTSLINIMLSVDDEIINHAETLVKFKNCSIKLFNNAGHVFTKFDKILPDIKTILENQ